MRRVVQIVARGPGPGGLVVVVASIWGALLGVLLMWSCLALASPADGLVVAERAPFERVSGRSRPPVVCLPPDTAPVSTVAWSANAPLPSQAAMGATGEKDTRFSTRRAWSAPAREPWSALSRHWLSLAVGALLGGIAAGASVSLWSTRRAMVRLQSRLGQFERLAAEGKGDWLTKLDSDLVGEWRDGQ